MADPSSKQISFARRPRGYHRLASMMAEDASLAIFRRFNEMNMLTLLRLQAEIFHLQRRLQFQCSVGDLSNDEALSKLSEQFFLLRESPDTVQYKLFAEIHTKLSEYNSLMLQVSQMSAIRSPPGSQLDSLRYWLIKDKGGNNFLQGTESRLWNLSERPTEFVCLQPSVGEQDPFTRLTAWSITNIFDPFFGKYVRVGRVIDEESGLASYSDSKVNLYSQVFTTILSSMLPPLTIYVLYAIKNVYWRIGATVGFTALFATFLAVFSTAKRVEIFTATATFAAVEVVFIGSALSSNT